MPTSKSKKRTNGTRKEEKPRPYRVDYFLHDEMLKDKALVRSKIVRAVTAKEASDDLASILPISAGELTVIRSYRFYKTLSAEPKKKTYIEIDKLLSAEDAIEVMTTIENRKVPIVIRPEDLPQDHPDHVCTDKCYDIVPLNSKYAKKAGVTLEDCMAVVDSKFVFLTARKDGEANEAKFFPKFGDPQPATVFVPEWGPDADTSNVAAGQPSPYTFPDKPLVPTKDAVFDDSKCGDEVVTSRGFTVCRWHGWKYIDLRDGRCTATDAGSGYPYDVKYQTELSIKRASGALQQFGNAVVGATDAAEKFNAVPRDLDEAAPVIHPAPVEAVRAILDDPNPNRDYSYREPTQAFYDKVDELPEPPVTAVETPDTLSIWRPTSHHGQPVAWKYDDSGFKRDPNEAVERS